MHLRVSFSVLTGWLAMTDRIKIAVLKIKLFVLGHRLERSQRVEFSIGALGGETQVLRLRIINIVAELKELTAHE